MLEHIVHILPYELKSIVYQLSQDIKDSLEEIRIRENRPLEISHRGSFHYVTEQGGAVHDSRQAYHPTQEQCRKLLERITNYSLYAMEEELRRGYITIAGGHRIGIAGRTILEGGIVRGIRDIGGFNIRIAREVVGASKQLLPKLFGGPAGSLQSTLIISPPQQGKTTILRDLARAISYGEARKPAMKVAIVDERSEIAACVKGIPSFDVGPRTDVMDACPKAEGMMMLLRSMSPEVIIVDEIGRVEDAVAIREAAHCGVKVIATAHAFNVEEVLGRSEIKSLIAEKAFSSIVELKRNEQGFMHRIISVERLLEPNKQGSGFFSLSRKSGTL
ncbi:stage III sporulation protein AA [Paenibacillus septentrionalis]|uniref:Stage III sporulation protein AA n=1 Tax=Paenibacillus septentrionalis TaxID=429342 RepID=A0ABW1V4T9_9BACL